ncbi:hypothetical protein [Paraglaciecola marina]|uniref:hypothetical protein n=1 Tax=Paraglaciecola marina TaxID=2500157 RepID=UPI0010608D4C|nr:hypothetical protein [Paraglaciecola marina]
MKSHKTRYYLVISALILIIPLLGFNTYFSGLFNGAKDSTQLIHTHVILYFGWIFLYFSQALLPSLGHHKLHIYLGKISIIYLIILVIDGLLMTFEGFIIRIEKGEVENAKLFLLQPLTDMIVFPALVMAAICFRKRVEIHKRLMLIATLMLTIAGIVRIKFIIIPGGNLLLWLSPVLLSMLYDYHKKKVIHPVYVFGILLFTLMYIRMRLIIHTPFWDAFSGWMVKVFSR